MLVVFRVLMNKSKSVTPPRPEKKKNRHARVSNDCSHLVFVIKAQIHIKTATAPKPDRAVRQQRGWAGGSQGRRNLRRGREVQ